MKRWDQRPFEIKNLFNPAFCGLILYRAMRGYEEADSEGIPFSLVLLVLPLCLHKDTREIIAANPRSYLLKIVNGHPQVLINFAQRARDLMPYTLEALGFLMERGCFSVSENGCLKSIPETVRKTISGSHETKSCQRVARLIGKEFSHIGDRATIYTTFGVRP